MNKAIPQQNTATAQAPVARLSWARRVRHSHGGVNRVPTRFSLAEILVQAGSAIAPAVPLLRRCHSALRFLPG